MTDYKNTLNLPSTAFPMKANLAQREPEILKFWENIHLYGLIRSFAANKPHFVLPDGPPYANGHIHIGHAVNKTLKDIICKAKTFSGYNAAFIPGWDCHGLPIELNVEKKVGKPGVDVTPEAFREACRQYAYEQIDIQRNEFKRLGVIADWDHPYLTMNPIYEANIIRSLAIILKQKHLHQGQKPVYWCLECASALAEAEVEYQDKTSPALDVRFKAVDESNVLSRFKLISEGKGPISIPIWTTTPWTLPSNEAVALNPALDYDLIQVGEEQLIIADCLLDNFKQRLGLVSLELLGQTKGQTLEFVELHHPFFNKKVPVVLGEHITTDVGTGAVHTAPSHGMDDFLIGQRYQLPLKSTVAPSGCYFDDIPHLANIHIRKADATLLTLLTQHNALLHQDKIQHSYPHCWRHKTPLIFLATPQWFISMEQAHLREKTLKAIPLVQWIPAWGQARITAMIENRPDWCISRQRTWGTPMGLIIHKKTRALHPRMTELMEILAQAVEKRGLEAWYELDLETLLGDEVKHYEKTPDTLDVWFDSGVAHYAVLRTRKELGFPADLFLEGSDQHRGWFQSSLLTSMAMVDAPPFKAVLTHGFTVDALGRKMSKSLGNVIAPEKVENTLGADVLRLWVANTDYSGELNVSDEILSRTSDMYRRLRNTLRFLLANIFDFNPEEHAVSPHQLLALDLYMLTRVQLLQEEIVTLYDQYQFHLICQKLHHFCTIDLSSFYLDIIKDRQYTCPKNSIARRSAQTVMFHMAQVLVRLFAPILSFTAEEIWKFLPGQKSESVFLNTWYELPNVLAIKNPISTKTWEETLNLRGVINKELEKLRTDGKIGSSLAADITLYCDDDLYQSLHLFGDELRFVFITGDATLMPAQDKPSYAKETEIPGLWLTVQPSTAVKCERCWHYRSDVGSHTHHPSLCGRCIINIEGLGESRLYA